jgi:hypothetical protein
MPLIIKDKYNTKKPTMKNLHTFEEFLNESISAEKQELADQRKKEQVNFLKQAGIKAEDWRDPYFFFPENPSELNPIQNEILSLLKVSPRKGFNDRVVSADQVASPRYPSGRAFDNLTKYFKSELAAPIVIDRHTIEFDRNVVKMTYPDGEVNYFWSNVKKTEFPGLRN